MSLQKHETSKESGKYKMPDEEVAVILKIIYSHSCISCDNLGKCHVIKDRTTELRKHISERHEMNISVWGSRCSRWR